MVQKSDRGQSFTAGSMQVTMVPCLRDNYSYLLELRDGRGECLIVDACETEPIARAIDTRGLHPLAILSTHHHHDHVGGNVELATKFGIPIFGHESERRRIPGLTSGLRHEQEFSVGAFHATALHVPGHTLGAIAYCLDEVCFTGDTLFCGGCGRLFEGTAEQMHHSLCHILAALPEQTIMCTGHEYAEGNLRFASNVFDRPAVIVRMREVAAARAQGRFCATSTLALEKATNPFLNCDQVELQRAVLRERYTLTRVESENSLEMAAFAELRRLKDAY